MKTLEEIRHEFNVECRNFYSRNESMDNEFIEGYVSLDFDKGFANGEVRVVNLEKLKNHLEEIIEKINEAKENHPELEYVVIRNNGFTPKYRVSNN